MAVHGFGSLVYWTSRLDACRAFYEAPNKRQGGASLIGFKVDDVDAVFARLSSLATEVLWEPQDAPWGRTAQLRDPDGRPLEIFQAG